MSIPKAPNLTGSSRLPQGFDPKSSAETANTTELSREFHNPQVDICAPSPQVVHLLGLNAHNPSSPQPGLLGEQPSGVKIGAAYNMGAVERAVVQGRLAAKKERTVAELLNGREVHPLVLQTLNEVWAFNKTSDLKITGWGPILELLSRLQNAGARNHQGLADAIAVVKALRDADATGLTAEQKAWSIQQEDRLVAQQFAHLAPKNFSAKLKEERQVMIALLDSQADVVAAGAESKTANGDAPPVMAASADPQLSASKLADQQLADAEKGRKLQNNSSDEQLAKAKSEATRQQVQLNYAVAAAAQYEEVGESAGGPLSRSNRGPIV